MSDKRATYAIGAVAAALALVLGLVTAVPASTVTTYSTGMGMMGHAEVVLKDKDGNIKGYQQSDNVVVLNGQDCAADLIFGVVTALCDSTADFFTFIAVGDDSATATDVDTELGNELNGLTRTGLLTEDTIAIGGPGGTGAMKTIVGTFTLQGDATIAEVGLFDSGTSDFPDMFSHIILGTAISAGDGDTITITYKITVG